MFVIISFSLSLPLSRAPILSLSPSLPIHQYCFIVETHKKSEKQQQGKKVVAIGPDKQRRRELFLCVAYLCTLFNTFKRCEYVCKMLYRTSHALSCVGGCTYLCSFDCLLVCILLHTLLCHTSAHTYTCTHKSILYVLCTIEIVFVCAATRLDVCMCIGLHTQDTQMCALGIL